MLAQWCVCGMWLSPYWDSPHGCSRQRLETQSKQASYPLEQRGLLPQITASKTTSTPKALCACLCECVCAFMYVYVSVCVLAMEVSWFGFSKPIFYERAFPTTSSGKNCPQMLQVWTEPCWMTHTYNGAMFANALLFPFIRHKLQVLILPKLHHAPSRQFNVFSNQYSLFWCIISSALPKRMSFKMPCLMSQLGFSLEVII